MEKEISNKKCTLIFLINLTNYTEISSILYILTLVQQKNIIQITVETIDDLRAITKSVNEKKKYFK